MLSLLYYGQGQYVYLMLEHDKVIAKKVEQNISCTTQYPDFDAVILNCLTLEIAYHQFKEETREQG